MFQAPRKKISDERLVLAALGLGYQNLGDSNRQLLAHLQPPNYNNFFLSFRRKELIKTSFFFQLPQVGFGEFPLVGACRRFRQLDFCAFLTIELVFYWYRRYVAGCFLRFIYLFLFFCNLPLVKEKQNPKADEESKA